MKNRHTFRIILFSLLGLIVVLVVGGIVISKLALGKAQLKLAAAGITIRTLDVNLFKRSITVEGFEWHSPVHSDTALSTKDLQRSPTASKTPSIHVTAERIYASGIEVWSFIRNKEINIGSLVLSKATVVTNHLDTERKRDNNSHNDYKIPFKQIAVNNLLLQQTAFILKNDSLEEHKGIVDITMRDIVLQDAQRFKEVTAYAIGEFEISLKNYRMKAQKSMYTLALSELAIDSRDKSLTLDSLVLLPKYGKYQFSRRLGKQIDRFILRVPAIKMAGLNFKDLRDSTIRASSLTIDRANLYVFRDKRLPFVKDTHTPLPVALIRSLPFGFALDSLVLADTKVIYEEFPEKGFETGHIVFDHLQAHAAHLTNRNYYPKVKGSVLHVTSHVMQRGTIKVDFTIPYDKAQIYNATGRISNLTLERLNPMFESLAFVRVESGKINSLDFNFDYDDYTSRGNIIINYEDLKLVALKKEEGKKENDLKSLALGLFVRKDKDREVALEKRTGKIYYERDRRKAIFNVWVRSLFSGIKSSVIDPVSERKQQTRKERRESIREERRENRAKNKKEKQEQKSESRSEKADSVKAISTI